MNENQVFIDAALACKKVINRRHITEIILKDKTNKIKKYLNSFGIRQLAIFLQELYRESTGINLVIDINDTNDPNQRKAQLRMRNGLTSKIPTLKIGKLPTDNVYNYTIASTISSEFWATAALKLGNDLVYAPLKEENP